MSKFHIVGNLYVTFLLLLTIDISGHTSAHHCCAAWSDGVLQTEEYMLQFVDKAVVAGLSKVRSIQFTGTLNLVKFPKLLMSTQKWYSSFVGFKQRLRLIMGIQIFLFKLL